MSKQRLLIKKKVASFREKAGLGEFEELKFPTLLIKLNVLTIFRPLSENFSGMAVKIANKPCILINSNQSRGRQNFTICHEFYHLFVQESFTPHRCNSNQFNQTDIEEKNADLFASMLLMPEDGILEHIPDNEFGKNKIHISTIIKIEQIFSVSHSALLYRLKDFGLIDQNYIDQNKNNVTRIARKYNFDTDLYKSGNEGEIIGDYAILADKAFESEKISEGHYIQLMDIFDNGEKED